LELLQLFFENPFSKGQSDKPTGNAHPQQESIIPIDSREDLTGKNSRTNLLDPAIHFYFLF